MKNYNIKRNDGSKQNELQGEFKSRYEAQTALMDFLENHNANKCIDDNDYLSVFEFTLEEVECKEDASNIKDFKSARKYLGLKKNQISTTLCIGASISEDEQKAIDNLLVNLNLKHLNALIALNKLFTIAEAWNKADDFVPDFSDRTQDKWFPWFVYKLEHAGFVCAHTSYAPSYSYALGSRLCFKTTERARQFGELFADLYNEVFL